MKKITSMILFLVMGSAIASADSKIKVVIADLHNIDRGGSLEACGTAIHADGTKPLLVTLTHDQSKFTTLTSEDGSWCVVFKRWTFSGDIAVMAATFDYSEKSESTLKLITGKATKHEK